MHKVFITGPIEEIGIVLLKKKGIKADVLDPGKKLTDAYMKEVMANYDGIITMVSDKIDERILENSSSKLRVISNYGVGFDNIDVLAARRRGVVVTNTPGVASESVAEHAFALILACAKKLIEADRFVRQGHYRGFDPKALLSRQVWGQTIGIVGLGKIGTYVGHIAYGGFKMNICYHDIVRSEDFEMLTEARFADMQSLLKAADIVTVHAPLTAQTHHLIGKEEFKKMKNSAIFVNTARGRIVDQDALIWALREGEILAAGLDVYEDETNVPSELRILPNVVLTPHSASATFETRGAMSRIAAQNVIDVFEKRTPFGLVTVR